METLKDKVVVVTGAGRGLGAALALTLADLGSELILCGRSMSDLQSLAGAITRRCGRNPDLVFLDLADTTAVKKAADDIASRKPVVDVLINNGAMWLPATTGAYEDSAVVGAVNAAVTGTFLLTQRLLPLLRASKGADVVTIGSLNGLPNAPLQTVSVPFYAAKRGQVALAEGLRQTFMGTQMRSILVNPPYLDDVRPDEPEWQESDSRQKGARATSRDVVEAVMFALTRPRHVSVTIDIDADKAGLFSHPNAT